MANSSSDLSSFMPEHELVELLWENGQIVMQGRSNRAKKGSSGTDSSFSGRVGEKGCGDDVNMVKFGQTGTLDPSAAHDLPHSVPCVMNSHEDDTAQWMNYPIDDDPLQNVYCPEFFSEITGAMASLSNTNSNLNTADKTASFGQSIKDSHGFLSPPEPSKSRFNHLFGMPQQCQILPETVKSKVVDLDNCNEHNSKRFQKQQDAGFQKPSHKNSNGLVNFSHFSRPAALVKANNLHNTDRSHEKSCTAAGTFTVESTLVADSGSNGKPRVDDVARVHNSVVVNRSSSSHCQNSSMNKERSEAERVPETVVASSSVCSGYSAGAASNDRKHKSKKRFREGEESGEQSDDLEDESFALKELSSGRGSNGKRSRAAEVHNLSERRRRDRINEKMKALQELIPNCNKVDKASMLDEAIEYLKTLQLQVQMMSMGSGFCMTPMRLPPGMNLQHLRSPQMSPFSPLGMGMGIGMGMGLGFGMGMIDLNGSPGLIPVSPMPGTQFPCPSGLSGLYRMPQSSNIHSLGIPAQRLPVSTPHNPFLNSQTGFPSQSTLMNPWQVSDTNPSTANNQQQQCINMELKREASQAVCHKDNQDMHGTRIMTLKPIIDSSNAKETTGTV